MTIPNVLSIAGSDPSGGAGIQADLKTFGALGCHGMAAITALTAQNTRGVSGIHVPPPAFVAQQIDAVFADIDVAAVKIGMLASAAIAAAVAGCLARHKPAHVVLDPVLVATSGDSLGEPDVVDALRRMMAAVTLVTPNLAEAARLAERPVAASLADAQATAERLCALGAPAVLVKGGHADGATSDDVLFDGARHHVLSAPRITTRNTHGTGCTLSSAIAAYLALGRALPQAVADAKAYLGGALVAGRDLQVGSGAGPVDHFYAWRGRQP
jgi:hydroxymethylpyrimidine/phosphomethylpyrimidine kinase